MDATLVCPACEKPLAPDAPQNVCPECLVRLGLMTETAGAGDVKESGFEPLACEELGRYFPQLDILGILGWGGMGAVYRARQRHLDRIVALKILPPRPERGRDFAGRFAREARALARLNHPHIVSLHEFGQSDGLFYFLMEYVDGVNLEQVLRTRRLAPEEALAIVPQICDALQFAHEHGILHRDVKPANILLSKTGQVKIADFGVAKILGEEANHAPGGGAGAKAGGLTQAGNLLGTRPYMAPEQVALPLDADHRADIYSVGVVFYEMLTGELPRGGFPPPSHKVQIDVRLDEVVLRALEQAPARRYQTAAEIKTAVETLAPAMRAAGARKSNRRRFALTVPAAGAITLLIAACMAIVAAMQLEKPVAASVSRETAKALWEAGAVALWRAEGNARDSIGGHDGALTHGVRFAPGQAGRAFSFSTPDADVVVPASPDLDVGAGEGFAFVAWIWPRDVTRRGPICEWNKGDGSGFWGVHFGIDPVSSGEIIGHGAGPGALYANLVDTRGDWHRLYSASNAVQAGRFQHVALTYDKISGEARIYCDGAVVAEKRLGRFTPVTAYDFHLGRRPPTLGDESTFTGLLDEPALFSRALSPEEIQAIYLAGRDGKSMPPMAAHPSTTAGLVAWWRAEDFAADTAGSNHGILENHVAFVPGIKGRAFLFDGKGAYVKVPQSPVLNLPDELTIELWMNAAPGNKMQNPQGLVASDFYFVGISNGRGGTNGVNFGISTVDDEPGSEPASAGAVSGSRHPGAEETDPAGSHDPTLGAAGVFNVLDFVHTSDANGGGAPVTAGEWHHVAGTYDGSKLQLYIDGEHRGRPVYHHGRIRPMNPGSFVTIGSEDGRMSSPTGIGTRYFAGAIGEVKIYRRALTASEIAADFDMERPQEAHLASGRGPR